MLGFPPKSNLNVRVTLIYKVLLNFNNFNFIEEAKCGREKLLIFRENATKMLEKC